MCTYLCLARIALHVGVYQPLLFGFLEAYVLSTFKLRNALHYFVFEHAVRLGAVYFCQCLLASVSSVFIVRLAHVQVFDREGKRSERKGETRLCIAGPPKAQHVLELRHTNLVATRSLELNSTYLLCAQDSYRLCLGSGGEHLMQLVVRQLDTASHLIRVGHESSNRLA